MWTEYLLNDSGVVIYRYKKPPLCAQLGIRSSLANLITLHHATSKNHIHTYYTTQLGPTTSAPTPSSHPPKPLIQSFAPFSPVGPKWSRADDRRSSRVASQRQPAEQDEEIRRGNGQNTDHREP